MECKGAAKASETAAGEGFNRNIVECKVALLESPPVLWQVLIETLWNVKFRRIFPPGTAPRSFNRNIVECKGGMRRQTVPSALSFNRNIVECKDEYIPAILAVLGVLIETLWNVKQIQLGDY